MSSGQANAEIAEGRAPTLNCLHEAPVVAFANKGHFGAMSQTDVSDPLRADGGDTGPGGVGVRTDGAAYTLEARAEVQAVAFDTTQITSKANRSNPQPGDPCHPLAAGAHAPAVAMPAGINGGDVAFALRASGSHSGDKGDGGMNTTTGATHTAVRRLTPRECERLQGFPDDYTAIPWGKKTAEDCPDGPRYKALGNSMATNAMRWLGDRIALVEEISNEEEARHGR